ncbi:hypothetical protein LCGC14_1479010 [marine sediment metagenome]|uniref:Resolvase HTH domain-containing protein n=1 Tax=marine sediment metagenome TaxID=412755 RepID=A0A0F9LQG5_9ZZZZ
MKKSNAKKKPKARKKPGPKLKGGRPTLFKQEFAEIAKELILHGMSLSKLAIFLKIHRDTLYQWMKDHPKFSDTITKAQDDYNCGRVEKSMLRSAQGFRFTETTHEADKDGNMVLTKKVRKFVPPNATMAIFWSTNRAKNRWKHQNRMEHDISPEAANFIMNIGKKKG